MVCLLLHFHTLLLQRSCFVLHGSALAFGSTQLHRNDFHCHSRKPQNFELRTRARTAEDLLKLTSLVLYVAKMIKIWMRQKLELALCVDVPGGVHSNICLGDDFYPFPVHCAGGCWPCGWFGVGAHRTFDVHQRCVEAQGLIQWSTSRGDLCWSNQVGRTTATGFDNEQWRHISNIVITSMFLLVAFGTPRSQALDSAVKPTREVILGGKWQQCFAWLAVPTRLVFVMMKYPAGLNDECVGALLILFAAKMEI